MQIKMHEQEQFFKKITKHLQMSKIFRNFASSFGKSCFLMSRPATLSARLPPRLPIRA
jgi:hypothetical protein